jgi:hypothetical protein
LSAASIYPFAPNGIFQAQLDRNFLKTLDSARDKSPRCGSSEGELVGRQLTDRVLLGDTLDFEAAAAALFAISHALRWKILRLAAVEERDASSLAYELNVTESITATIWSF